MLRIILPLLVLSSCAQIKKMQDDLEPPEIMSAEDSEQYFRNKIVENLPLLRKCLEQSPGEKVVKFEFLIEAGKVKKSEAHSLHLNTKEKACLTQTAGAIDFMMLKNYSAQQTLKFYPEGK